MNASVYLDYNATAPIRPEAEQAVLHALRTGGNPSSVHASGRAARAIVERAREQVAALVGARPADVIFTSGGTEANAIAIESAVLGAGCRRLIIGATEHPSVIETAMATGRPLDIWPVDGDGRADLDWLQARLGSWDAADGRPFVALMLANNETGVIQPVAEAAALVQQAGGWLHVDAVQAAGKLPIRIYDLADTLAISSHKLGGPSGAGALVANCGAELVRRTHGGGQEKGRRGGTENLSGIAGFGAAAQASSAPFSLEGRRVGDGGVHTDVEGQALEGSGAWRDAAAERLEREAGVVILGQGAPRLANTLCIATPGFASETQVMALDLAGVMVSSGAACSSGKVKASHVIEAMGRPDLAACAIRVSGGWATTQAHWSRFADAWLQAHARHAARARPLVEA
jgi:cysteine desulfurase